MRPSKLFVLVENKFYDLQKDYSNGVKKDYIKELDLLTEKLCKKMDSLKSEHTYAFSCYETTLCNISLFKQKIIEDTL